MALCTFAIPVKDVSGRLGLLSGCFLAVLAYRYIVNEILPRKSYLTAADMYISFACLFQIGICAQTVVFGILRNREDGHKNADELNKRDNILGSLMALAWPCHQYLPVVPLETGYAPELVLGVRRQQGALRTSARMHKVRRTMAELDVHTRRQRQRMQGLRGSGEAALPNTPGRGTPGGGAGAAERPQRATIHSRPQPFGAMRDESDGAQAPARPVFLFAEAELSGNP